MPKIQRTNDPKSVPKIPLPLGGRNTVLMKKRCDNSLSVISKPEKKIKYYDTRDQQKCQLSNTHSYFPVSKKKRAAGCLPS